MKILSMACLAFGLAVAALSPAAAQDKITIATEGAYAPWNFTTADGKPDGMEVELARNLCGRMKIECTVITQDWDGLIPALKVGKFDVIMASMFITDKRLEVIDFTQPYAIDPSGFAVAKDSPLAAMPVEKISLADEAKAMPTIEKMKAMLKCKVIGVQASTVNLEFVKKYFGDVVEIREYKTTEQHDLDLAAGRIDGIFAQQTALAATLAKPEYANYAVAGPGFYSGIFGRGTGAGIRKEDTALKDKLNKAIDDAIADGTIKALSLKWLKADVTPIK